MVRYYSSFCKSQVWLIIVTCFKEHYIAVCYNSTWLHLMGIILGEMIYVLYHDFIIQHHNTDHPLPSLNKICIQRTIINYRKQYISLRMTINYHWMVNKQHQWWNSFLQGLLRPINSSPPGAAYMLQWTGSSLVQVMACHLFGTKPLPETMLAYCQLDCWEHISMKFELEI